MLNDDDTRPLGGLALGVDLRPFQERALAALRSKASERSLHCVAPPGAGKTVLGLALLIERGWPAVIVSPTGTIAAQWVERFEELVVDTGTGALPSPGRWISRDPFEEPGPLISSVTYQALSVKARGEDELHENVERLFERLREIGVRTVILDESHHLKNHWANAISMFVDGAADTTLLALTATPPVDASADERRRHVGLVGEVDYEIALPALVKSGFLAPFQDLVQLVEPTRAEHAYLAGAHERFESVWHELAQPTPPLDSLRLWLDERLSTLAASELDDPGAGDWGTLLRDDPDLAIALGRVVREFGGALPTSLWGLDEMDEPAQLADKIRTIEAYLLDRIGPIQEGAVAHPLDPEGALRASSALWESVRDALRPIGFVLTKNGIQRRAASVDRIVGLSAAKYDALVRILRAESDSLLDDLRAVVVTDFERAATGKAVRELEGVLDPTAGGAVSVLRRLAADEVLGELDAVMVSGTSLVCDADVASSVRQALLAHAGENGLRIDVDARRDGVLVELVGRGPDWSSATYVLLVTRLFEQGVTRCLVGTRGLLGEGWDARRANVLVDLTSVSAFVSTNQLRGRCLRLDPERPEKVANLWDVVTVAPDMERGFADWERLVRKHSHVFGLADDGEIERGIGHVHPTFTHLVPSELAPVLSAVNEEMMARVEQRGDARASWNIGGNYGDERIVSVELRPTESDDTGAGSVPALVRAARIDVLAKARAAADQARRDAAKRVERQEAKHERRAQEIEDAFEKAMLDAESSVGEAETALVAVTKDVTEVRARAAVTGFFGALAILLAGDVVFGVAAALLLVPMIGIIFRGESRRKSKAVGLLEDARSGAVRRRQKAERTRDRALDRLQKARRTLDEKNAVAVADAVDAVDRAKVSLDASVDSVEEALLYGRIVLTALRRLAERGEGDAVSRGSNVEAHRRVDGSISVSVTEATTAVARTFGEALRDLVRPIGTQRYVLLVGDEPGVGEDLADEGVVLPVPQPFASSRRGAREFLRAFRDVVGGAELLYTRSGEGREVLGRHARQRWSSMRGFARETWR